MFLSDIRAKQQVFENEGYKVSWTRTFLSDGTSASFFYRVTFWLMHIKLYPVALAFHWLNKVINGCVIGATASFGKGLVIMHPVGIVVNSKVKGGRNIVLESGVVIGDEKGQSPIIGSNVFIGAGAKIIGKVSIGNNVKIGANAVVIKDIPDDCTAVGIPAKILKPKQIKEDSID